MYQYSHDISLLLLLLLLLSSSSSSSSSKRDAVRGEWRKLNNEELNNLYSSADIIKQVKSSQGE
jgi:hypothetical protein